MGESAAGRYISLVPCVSSRDAHHGYFSPQSPRGIISTMDDNSRHQARETLLADLASARADLVAIQADTLRKLLAARSAIAIATLASLGPETVCEAGDGGAPLTVARLADLVRQC